MQDLKPRGEHVAGCNVRLHATSIFVEVVFLDGLTPPIDHAAGPETSPTQAVSVKGSESNIERGVSE